MAGVPSCSTASARRAGRPRWRGLAQRGLIVSYGNASGPVPPLSPLELARGGSLFLTRPTLFDYVASDRRSCRPRRRGCSR